jgi:hypothetical protein
MMLHPIPPALLLLSVLGWSLLWPWAAFGHRLDEYLQATLVEIEPAGRLRLQINLTPGVQVADRVLALIDRNRDGTISTNEAAAYLDLLKRDLVLRLDGHDLKLQLTSSYCPGMVELRTGWAFIQAEYSTKLTSFTPGLHTIIFQNRHLPALSVYLINAAQPESPPIEIIKQNRNKTQSSGQIEFTFRSPDSHPGP